MVHSPLLGSVRYRAVPVCVRQELEQEARLRTLSAEGVDCPTAYARRVARNLAIDYLRRRRTVPFEEGQLACPSSWREEALDLRRLAVLLPLAPASHREVLTRLFLREESVSAMVAEVAGGPRKAVDEATWSRARDAVYKRRRRALTWLRERG